MKLLTKADIQKAIDSIAKRGKVLDNDIHIAACSSIALRKESGDTAWINRLFLALPAGARKAALTDWLLQFGGVIANDGSDKSKPKGEQPFLHTRDKAVELEAGMASPWFDHKVEPMPDEVYDIMAAVQAVIRKAKTASGKAGVVHGELLATLASIVETGALSSNTVSDESSNSPSGESGEGSEKSLLPMPGIDLAKGLIDGQPAAMSH